MSENEEMVLVIRRELFDRLGAFQGLSFEIEKYLPSIHSRENNSFLPRSRAEQDPSFKQIIPYVILTHQGRVLHYVRGKKGGEQRLASKGSIGIGGHVNEGDNGLVAMDGAAYATAVQREISEELQLNTGYSNRIVALLNDDSNEVGQVHLGIVHVFHLENDHVSAGEAVIENLQFLPPADLHAKRDALESWSQICADHLERLIGAGA